MNITKGKKSKAQKVVLYGVPGIGKSTLASKFPNPIFIDTEGSTDNMDVMRFDKPTSYEMLNQQIEYALYNPVCQTLVIDTIDWAEQLLIKYVCSKHGKNGIEEFGYGTGYVYVREELSKLLNLLSELVNKGINVLLLAHSQIAKFELPEEQGSYDRYQLKLSSKGAKRNSELILEWADMVLFCNYKTIVQAVDKDGKKHKAQGNRRVMYTTQNAVWEAKNRHNLPEELNLDFKEIAHIFENQQVNITQEVQEELSTIPNTEINQQIGLTRPAHIPVALWDLMKADDVSEHEICTVVEGYGLYPKGTHMSVYSEAVMNRLVAGWNTIKQQAFNNRESSF